VLEAFCHLQSPASGWKLVVVDNCSTDQTPQVIASFADRLPLYSVLEPKLGKNHALNTGLGLTDGDLTVLTDDDVFPNADWLIQFRRAADALPAYSIFGGLVLPCWEVPPPPWIQWVDVGTAFSIHPSSVMDGQLPAESLSMVYGPNMAIRTSIFHSGIRFDASIGPCGSNYPMGSETELVLRLSRQGHEAFFLKTAIVQHFVRKEQLNKAWVLERAVRCGRGRHRLYPNVRSYQGIPLHLFRDVLKEGFLVVAAWVTCRQEGVFRARWRFNILRGKAVEAFSLAREQRAAARLASSPLSQK